MISIKNVSFYYNNLPVFEDLNFELNKNKLIGVFGKNGVGKTTLLKLILGVERPSAGELVFDFGETPKLERFGALIENPPLIDYMTVFENLNYKRLFLGLGVDCIEEAIHSCQLSNYKHILVKSLSLGNKQKLGIALAILNKPKVLLLDEPTNSIDSETSKEIMELIVGFKESQGCSIILISHDQELLNLYSDELFELDEYKLKKKV